MILWISPITPLGNVNPTEELMAVKHIPTAIVHSGYKGGKTGCGFDTNVKPSHWKDSHERINCDKNGCR